MATKTAIKAKTAKATKATKKPAAKSATKSSAKSVPAPRPAHGSIVHVEFSTPSLEKAKKLYGSLFGWEFHPFKPTEMYFQTPNNWGPCGCVSEGSANQMSASIYVNVNDIPGTIAKATKLGASVELPRTEIPGGHGYFAHLRMADGNIFGIYCQS